MFSGDIILNEMIFFYLGLLVNYEEKPKEIIV